MALARRHRVIACFIFGAPLLALVALCLWGWRDYHHRYLPQIAARDAAVAAVGEKGQVLAGAGTGKTPVWVTPPYSPKVITGYGHAVYPEGIHTLADLHKALSTGYYPSFKEKNAQEITLQGVWVGYVGYLFNGHLYWTRHRVYVHYGEKLWTDGREFIRERCGNPFSFYPQSPWMSRKKEPTDLEEPVLYQLMPEVTPEGNWKEMPSVSSRSDDTSLLFNALYLKNKTDDNYSYMGSFYVVEGAWGTGVGFQSSPPDIIPTPEPPAAFMIIFGVTFALLILRVCRGISR